jgi:hypothetical protein
MPCQDYNPKDDTQDQGAQAVPAWRDRFRLLQVGEMIRPGDYCLWKHATGGIEPLPVECSVGCYVREDFGGNNYYRPIPSATPTAEVPEAEPSLTPYGEAIKALRDLLELTQALASNCSDRIDITHDTRIPAARTVLSKAGA